MSNICSLVLLNNHSIRGVGHVKTRQSYPENWRRYCDFLLTSRHFCCSICRIVVVVVLQTYIDYIARWCSLQTTLNDFRNSFTPQPFMSWSWLLQCTNIHAKWLQTAAVSLWSSFVRKNVCHTSLWMGVTALFGQTGMQRSKSDWILIAWGWYAEALFYQ